MAGQEVAIVGRLGILPSPIYGGQVQKHRLELVEIGLEYRCPVLQLIQKVVEGQQILHPGEPAAHPRQVGFLQGAPLQEVFLLGGGLMPQPVQPPF